MTENERLAALRSLLPEGRGGLLAWPEEADSTNRALRTLAEAGAEAGSAVLAEGQTAGRGRLGRRFASPSGKGIYLSYLLRPSVSPEAAGLLTGFAAVAVRRAIRESCGLETEIKWVNDLFAGGRKLCGILAESALRGAEADHIVLGVGVNVTAEEGDFPPELRESATSILAETGSAPDRIALAAALLGELDALKLAFPEKKAEYLAEYRASCLTLGREVTLSDGTRGLAEAVGEDFSLLVRLENGEKKTLRSGEASLHGQRP